MRCAARCVVATAQSAACAPGTSGCSRVRGPPERKLSRRAGFEVRPSVLAGRVRGPPACIGGPGSRPARVYWRAGFEARPSVLAGRVRGPPGSVPWCASAVGPAPLSSLSPLSLLVLSSLLSPLSSLAQSLLSLLSCLAPRSSLLSRPSPHAHPPRARGGASGSDEWPGGDGAGVYCTCTGGDVCMAAEQYHGLVAMAAWRGWVGHDGGRSCGSWACATATS